MHLGFSEILLRLRRQLMHMMLRSRVCLSADEYSEQLSPSYFFQLVKSPFWEVCQNYYNFT